ncbi:MAG TPA: aminotransferase class I/II-fold pyridoxal phosphate-dependent enzyme [Candidatus Thermoplasmatota archaeon]|nr:aminotransferase class I/II-fold pyridoxal phosphate-dependent enzyme [Candidatus Thermoplasmatota archaeon]
MSELRDFRIEDPRVSERVHLFPESVIREMTRLALQHGALNLAQGFPDWNPPAEIIEAARAALLEDYNQYSVTWGAPALRQAIAAKVGWFNGLDVHPDKHVTVTCGSTEAMMAAMLAVVDPGDEVVVFEPFYENYGPDALMSGAKLRFVPLRADRGFAVDEEALKAAFNERTKAVIVNTPNNPAGKVFTREELNLLGDLCAERDALILTDEIYEHILYGGRPHVAPATLPGLRERTIMISGASKTYAMTGWRVAWLIADETLSVAIRRTHDFLTVGAPHPLQIAVAQALQMPRSYYDELARSYDRKRRFLLAALKEAGFDAVDPQGAYYVLAGFEGVDAPREAKRDDRAFAEWLTRERKVACVPGSSFYSKPEEGRGVVRFNFAKRERTLEAAAGRLRA